MKIFSRSPESGSISNEMSIVKILSAYPLAREVFKRYGIEFIGKNLSPLESLDTVAKGNGLGEGDVDSIVQEINKGIKKVRSTLFSGELIKVTKEASEHLGELIQKKQIKGIRLRLVSDGCGLYSYDMDFGTKKLEGEMVYETQGIKFFLTKKNIGLLKGVEISLKGDAFFFDNPNVKTE